MDYPYNYKCLQRPSADKLLETGSCTGYIPAPKEPESDLLPLVMELPKNYRISIYLHYYEGYQVKEIASILRKPENSVSAYLARGRKKLKSVLESRSEYPYAAAQGGTHYAK